MKKILMLVLCLSFLIAAVYADDYKQPIRQKSIELPQGSRLLPTREEPEYVFTKVPTPLLTSFSDYMPGSYNGLPMRVIPDVAGGGYFITYHAARSATALRRVFYAYIDANGTVINNAEISLDTIREGYPSLAIDPVSGKPMYAWHTDADPSDALLEVRFVSDAFIEQVDGLWNDFQVIVNNPITTTTTGGLAQNDNEFLWPTLAIGPSNVEGKRRIYVAARNSVTHTSIPSENVYIAWADFDQNSIENGDPMVWTSTTIPTLNDWNSDTAQERRPQQALATDAAGNIYYIGYHNSWNPDDTPIDEDDFDVFKLSNYGQGEWVRTTFDSVMPAWNPPLSATDPTGYFTNDSDVPYTDEQMRWTIVNSSHLNAAVDDLGRIHLPLLVGLGNYEGSYYTALQFAKEAVYNTNTNEFSIKDVYPIQDPSDTYNSTFTPWDMEAPWGEVDEFLVDSTTNESFPGMVQDWNFPYWNEESHDNAMMFHLSNQKITEGNGYGMLANVWQNSLRARWFNKYADPDVSAFGNTPEIYISVSPDNGATWSEPIVLNNQETPQFAGIKPMYVYPADKVQYVGMQGDNKVGKIGLFFFDDNTWGSNTIASTEFPNDGGRLMFAEIQVVFPLPSDTSNEDNTVTAAPKMLNQNFPNPFNPETTISFDMPKAAPANLSIYNVKGQLVKTLFNGNAAFGRNNMVWNGTDNNGASVTSGLYFYRLSTDGKVETRKMMLMK